MMIYFDTNILIYAIVNQGNNRMELSKKLIEKALDDNEFYISNLVLIEYIFGLSKLKILDKKSDTIDIYSKFCKDKISKIEILNAYEKCQKLSKCRNINDFIHLEIANKHCKKIVTFDSDFKNLQKFYDVEIEILGNSNEME